MTYPIHQMYVWGLNQPIPFSPMGYPLYPLIPWDIPYIPTSLERDIPYISTTSTMGYPYICSVYNYSTITIFHGITHTAPRGISPISQLSYWDKEGRGYIAWGRGIYRGCKRKGSVTDFLQKWFPTEHAPDLFGTIFSQTGHFSAEEIICSWPPRQKNDLFGYKMCQTGRGHGQ